MKQTLIIRLSVSCHRDSQARNGSRALLLPAFLACASVARADFNPIALTPSSFNQDIVVESNAAATVPPINAFVNVTMDGGTNKTVSTWYEQGYNTANPAHGLPPHGLTVVSGSDSNHVFQMPPTYATNCAVMVGHQAGPGTATTPTGTLTVTAPAAFAALSVLSSSGTGPVPVQVAVHHADATTETFNYSCLDWLNFSANVTNAAGRIRVDSGAFLNEGSNPAGALFNNDFVLANAASPIASIVFSYFGASYNNGRACIFAVSGSTDGTHFSPITVSGYNADPVVEAGATPNTNFPAGIVTATMDSGTNFTTGTPYTWYEEGYYTNDLTTGLPAAGSTLTSAQLPSAHYLLPPSWAANNAVMVDFASPTANITPAVPAPYQALSFLTASGYGDNVLPCIIQHADGTSETNVITSFDWLKTSVPWAYQARGAGVNCLSPAINNLPEQTYQPPLDPRVPVAFVRRLFDSVVTLTNTSSAVTNILVVRTNTTTGPNTTRCVIFAVSGAPVGSTIAPFIPSQAAQPKGIGLLDVPNGTTAKNWAGSNVVLSVGPIVGTAPFTYQWQKAPRGGGARAVFDYTTFRNLTDDGTNIIGSTTATLTISNGVPANSGDYLVIIGNAGGWATSAVATVQIFSTGIMDVPLPGDTITAFGGASPAAETVDHAIDDLISKYLNFGSGPNPSGNPFVGPVGFIVQPSQGASVVSGLRLYSANDSSGRDPDDVMLEGSNDGAAWSLIYSNGLTGTLAIPLNRSGGNAVNPIIQNVTEILFSNTVSYSYYRWTVANVDSPFTVNSMQIGEVELLGVGRPRFTLFPTNLLADENSNPTLYSWAFAVLTYQWYQSADGGVSFNPVPGATNADLTITNVLAGYSGYQYEVVASNQFGSTTSTPPAVLTVASGAPYLVHDLGPGEVVLPGDTLTLEADFAGSLPIYYQWQKDGVNLSNGPHMSGATSNALTIANVTLADSGGYRVIASNATPPSASSRNNIVSVVPGGLVLHLKFDGDLLDYSGRGNNGTNVGATTFVPGKIGSQALHYSTTSSFNDYNYVTLGLRPDLQFGSDANFSVAFWILWTEPPGTVLGGNLPYLCNAINSTSNPGYTFAPGFRTGGWAWSLYDLQNHGTGVYGPNMSLSDRNWHHLAFTFDRAGSEVTYLDGIQVSSAAISNIGNVDTGQPTNIGQDPTGRYPVDSSADIDDMAVWRRVLTASEISSMYWIGATSGVSFVSSPVTISIQPSGNQVQLIWSGGLLQSADDVGGPYTDVPGATTPYTLAASAPKKFYRVRE